MKVIARVSDDVKMGAYAYPQCNPMAMTTFLEDCALGKKSFANVFAAVLQSSAERCLQPVMLKANDQRACFALMIHRTN